MSLFFVLQDCPRSYIFGSDIFHSYTDYIYSCSNHVGSVSYADALFDIWSYFLFLCKSGSNTPFQRLKYIANGSGLQFC